MEVSKITFTEDFKKKAKKGISKRKLGELRRKKLQELDEHGGLHSARNRSELGRLLGATGDKAAYACGTSLVSRGLVSETLRGFENGKAVYEYHIENVNTAPKTDPKATAQPGTQTEAERDASPVAMAMTITMANTVVKLENVGDNCAIEIIKMLNK